MAQAPDARAIDSFNRWKRFACAVLAEADVRSALFFAGEQQRLWKSGRKKTAASGLQLVERGGGRLAGAVAAYRLFLSHERSSVLNGALWKMAARLLRTLILVRCWAQEQSTSYPAMEAALANFVQDLQNEDSGRFWSQMRNAHFKFFPEEPFGNKRNAKMKQNNKSASSAKAAAAAVAAPAAGEAVGDVFEAMEGLKMCVKNTFLHFEVPVSIRGGLRRTKSWTG